MRNEQIIYSQDFQYQYDYWGRRLSQWSKKQCAWVRFRQYKNDWFIVNDSRFPIPYESKTAAALANHEGTNGHYGTNTIIVVTSE